MTGDSPVKKTSKHVDGRQSLSANRLFPEEGRSSPIPRLPSETRLLLGSFVCPSGFPAFSEHFCAPGLWKSVAKLQQQIRLFVQTEDSQGLDAMAPGSNHPVSSLG